MPRPLFRVSPARDAPTFNIEIAEADGAQRTVLGFATEAEAEAWIAEAVRMREIAERLVGA